MGEGRPGGAGPSRMWEVVTTREFDAWSQSLTADRNEQVIASLRRVANDGPNLGRPRVDSIKGSRVHNLKELRVAGGVRVLFAFDPNRRAVMLMGGDKTGSWNRWYPRNVRAAERLYGEHLRSIGNGDRCLSRAGVSRKAAERDR